MTSMRCSWLQVTLPRSIVRERSWDRSSCVDQCGCVSPEVRWLLDKVHATSSSHRPKPVASPDIGRSFGHRTFGGPDRAS